jgi:uncharacterized membrane protein YqjE
MFDSQSASPGLFTSLRKLLDTGLAALQTRAELLSVEFKEEKDHAAEMLIWLMMVVFFAIMAALLLSATIIVLFPEGLRVYAAGGLTLIYFAGAIWSFAGLRTRLKNRPIPFSATVEEFKKDREWLLK